MGKISDQRKIRVDRGQIRRFVATGPGIEDSSGSAYQYQAQMDESAIVIRYKNLERSFG
jgi:hypothetical protein